MHMIRLDLHTHTGASFDSWLSAERYVEGAARAGLGAVAITDHGTIDGALAVRDLDPPFRVIVGQEILTAEGELIGLFLERAIPTGVTADEAIDRVRAQGGLILMPHPFARYAFDRVKNGSVHRLAERVDLIEVANARNRGVDDARAARLARRMGIPAVAGSDSHAPWEIGTAFQTVRPFDGPGDLVDALRESRPVIRRRAPLVLSIVCAAYGLFSMISGRANVASGARAWRQSENGTAPDRT